MRLGTHRSPRSAARSPPDLLPRIGRLQRSYSALLEELASHGYVVAAIQHTYGTSAVGFPDQRLVRFGGKKWNAGDQDPLENRLRFYRSITDVWASDAVFVLDQLAQLEQGTPASVLKGRLDLTHVGIFGHSFGGIAAAQACERDDRFKACLNLDGMRAGLVYLPDDAGHGPRSLFCIWACGGS